MNLPSIFEAVTPHTTTQPVQVFFIRHGETAWTLTGQHTGRTDLPLTANGEASASLLSGALQDLSFAHVLCSPRLRARTTCELAGLGSQIEIEPDLAEWDYGDYEGLRTRDIQHLHADWTVWNCGCPGGERAVDVSARADRLICRLQNLSGRVALFSHGQLGRVLAARWIGIPAAQGRHLALDPASISIFGFEREHPHARIISLWNSKAGGRLT